MPILTYNKIHGEELKNTHVSIYGGFGVSYYYDNMEANRYILTNVNDFSWWGFSSKIMWEPPHRLSVGLELGYYQMYEYNDISDLNIEKRAIDAYVIPILLNCRVKVIDNFSLGIGTGVVRLTNKIATVNTSGMNYSEKMLNKNSILSLANYSIFANYFLPINRIEKMSNILPEYISNHASIGADIRYLWIGKTNDNIFTLQLVIGYKF